MTCQALINTFLMDYCTGALPLARKLEFEFHLSLCPECRAYLHSYRTTISLAKTAVPSLKPVPPGLIDAILKTVRSPDENAASWP